MEQNMTETGKRPKISYVMPALAIVLAILVVFFARQTFKLKQEMANSPLGESSSGQNQDNLKFALMFIEKVLEADKEIDFETRLELENAVRALNDKEILVQWQKFTSSQDEKNAQEEVKKLLKMTISRSLRN